MINLNNILIKYEELDTLIMTVLWKGYLNNENIGFLHEKVNHSKNFLNLDDKSIHTQPIESQWAWLKNMLNLRVRISKSTQNFILRSINILKTQKAFLKNYCS
ncbi:hypothetical protein CDIK_2434 [Cucumispora dikerogammari]|nr:hypothetical protein CDIK_2434 [Cucumispora dikerogammari]